MPHDASDDSFACPLAALCAEAERLLVRRGEAERVMEDARYEEEREHAARIVREADLSLAHIALRASDLRPASRRGALFTLALAAAEAQALAPPASDEAARLRRRLYALRAFLEADEPSPLALPAQLPGPVASRWMQVDCDPLALLME
ncbi:hypothetical protein [Salinarimonas sp.]|uniref:hypothetical protein n=1 Tax=Salinarimonas sp. TaxID=2766526 RepID=UPI0032D97535